ncbi:class I SAM-dependent methyltransferase [Pseudonocardia hydrocarbonoxydans]|uniref:Methyltransferase n=1 Tax=Pseudonocardia hydrocarbonoxydans TaxID=76726 RepID=A0A4Y3WSI6_9PSEU|nr:class I SAM-dependent methyltransferase [Pseudonocardia hydrocarbonoxydans]GEC20739.1 methyltransferase [Pseudonocardia hydrocarbonoxydans]
MTPPEGSYASGLLGGDPTAERERLGGIQDSVDGFTRQTLVGLGLAPDWTCLELGAGAGSIARWLAECCTSGSVLAVDTDTALFGPARAPRLTVHRADITDGSFRPGRFDLVHARFVLCHLPDRDAVLARAASWLRPGGVLVITDPYQLPPGTSPFPSVARLMAAYEAVHAAAGADLTWSRRVPSLLARAGLRDVGFAARPGCLGNGAADRWRPLLDAAAQRMIDSGAVTRHDLDAFRADLADPAFVDVPQLTLAAWGRRPAG